MNIELNDYRNITKELFSKFELDDKIITRITQKCTPFKVDKGKIFSSQDMKCDKIGILLSGILYAYSIDDKGEKRISRFFYLPDNPIVVDLESFTSNSNSEETIECIESSYLITISKKDLYDLYHEIPQMNKIGRVLAEESYSKALKKIKLLQTKNGKQRIELLMKQSPELFKKVAKSYIASYLGMHRNTFEKAFKQIE